MHALGASLEWGTWIWFQNLAPGSITGYDMFTNLLKYEWGNNIEESIHEPSNDDGVDEDQFDE